VREKLREKHTRKLAGNSSIQLPTKVWRREIDGMFLILTMSTAGLTLLVCLSRNLADKIVAGPPRDLDWSLPFLGLTGEGDAIFSSRGRW
jgi:hypothetical protein